MKKVLLFLFPLWLFAEDLLPLEAPCFEEVVAEKKLTFAKRIPSALESTLRAVVTEKKWQSFFTAEFTKKSCEANIESWVEAHNLKIAKKSETPRDQLFLTKSEFVFFLEKWLPQLEELPEELRGEFLSEVAERYLDIFPPDAEGSIHFLVESVTFEIASTHIS